MSPPPAASFLASASRPLSGIGSQGRPSCSRASRSNLEGTAPGGIGGRTQPSAWQLQPQPRGRESYLAWQARCALPQVGAPEHQPDLWVPAGAGRSSSSGVESTPDELAAEGFSSSGVSEVGVASLASSASIFSFFQPVALRPAALHCSSSSARVVMFLL